MKNQEEKPKTTSRPRTEVEVLKKNFLEFLSISPSITYAAVKTGISRRTYYNWIKDKKFKKAVDEILKKRCEILEDVMYQTAMKGNPTLQIFLACNWMPEKYKNIQKVDIEGKEVIKINIQPIDSGNNEKGNREEKTGGTE